MPTSTKILFFCAFFHGLPLLVARGIFEHLCAQSCCPPTAVTVSSSPICWVGATWCNHASIPMHRAGGQILRVLSTHRTRSAARGLPWAAISARPGLTPAMCPALGAVGCQNFFPHLPARLAPGAVPASAPAPGCLSAVFVLICSLRLLAAKLKLIEWENRGPLSPGLFSLSAHADTIMHWAGAMWWWDHSGTLGAPQLGTWCFHLSQQFSCPSWPPELLARGFCSQRDVGWVPAGCLALVALPDRQLPCHSLVPREGSAGMWHHLAALMSRCPPGGPWGPPGAGWLLLKVWGCPATRSARGRDALSGGEGDRTLVPRRRGMGKARVRHGGCGWAVPIPQQLSLDPTGQ